MSILLAAMQQLPNNYTAETFMVLADYCKDGYALEELLEAYKKAPFNQSLIDFCKVYYKGVKHAL